MLPLLCGQIRKEDEVAFCLLDVVTSIIEELREIHGVAPGGGKAGRVPAQNVAKNTPRHQVAASDSRAARSRLANFNVLPVHVQD
jgi:hypothetical protein